MICGDDARQPGEERSGCSRNPCSAQCHPDGDDVLWRNDALCRSNYDILVESDRIGGYSRLLATLCSVEESSPDVTSSLPDMSELNSLAVRYAKPDDFPYWCARPLAFGDWKRR